MKRISKCLISAAQFDRIILIFSNIFRIPFSRNYMREFNEIKQKKIPGTR